MFTGLFLWGMILSFHMGGSHRVVKRSSLGTIRSSLYVHVWDASSKLLIPKLLTSKQIQRRINKGTRVRMKFCWCIVILLTLLDTCSITKVQDQYIRISKELCCTIAITSFKSLLGTICQDQPRYFSYICTTFWWNWQLLIEDRRVLLS